MNQLNVYICLLLLGSPTPRPSRGSQNPGLGSCATLQLPAHYFTPAEYVCNPSLPLHPTPLPRLLRNHTSVLGLRLHSCPTNRSICAIFLDPTGMHEVETGANFLSLGSKITADGDCSHESKSHLLLGGKTMTNLDILLKSRDFTLPTKVRLVKAMVFPVVMCGCESWTIKRELDYKAERRRIDAFKLWCSDWQERSNQSILKEISPGCSLEGLMLKLKLQYFGHLM